MDVYVKKYNPQATNKEIIRMGRIVDVVGCVFAVLMALAHVMVCLYLIFKRTLGRRTR